MTGKTLAHHLDTLEKRWQELQDKAGVLPEACEDLEIALREVSVAIAAVRAAHEAGLTPPEEIPGGPAAPAGEEPGEPPPETPARRETILSHIFDAIPDLITVVDGNFNVVMSNWHGVDFIREEEKRGLPKCYRVYVHRDRPCEPCQAQEVFATGKPYKREWISPITGQFWEIYAFPILDESGRVVLVAEHLRNITERHLAEKALKASEAKYRELVENASSIILRLDTQGNITFFNEFAQTFFGYREEEIVGRNVVGTIVPEKDANGYDLAAKLRDVVKHPERYYSSENENMRRNGERVWVAWTNKVVYGPDGKSSEVLCIGIDRTEQRRAEQALRASEGRFRTLIENNPESLFVTDVQGTVLAASRIAAQRLGKNLAEVTGASMFELFSPEVASRRRPFFEQAVATGRPVRLEDTRENFHFEIQLNPILNAAGKMSMLSIMAIDITDRKNAEHALKESEARFRAVFETAHDSIFIKDRSLRYTQVNPAMERLFDRPAADLIGKTDAELFGEAAGAHIRAVDQRVLNGEVVKETHTRPVLGADTAFHVIKVPLRDETGKIAALCGIARDITDLKRAEAALREREATLRTLIETNPESLLLLDTRGVILAASKVTAQRLRKTLEEIIGANLWPLLPPATGQKRFEIFQQVAATGQPARFEDVRGDFYFDTYLTPIIDQDKVVQFAVLGVDITLRKQAEEALRESEQRFRDITENAAEWVWEVDAQGKYTYSSPVVEQLLGYKPEEVLDKHFYDLFIPEEREKLKQAELAVFAAKQPFRDFLNPNLHKNGQIVWLSTSGIPILDEQGNLRGYRGADIDMTERKEAEELSSDLITKSPFGIYLLQDRKLQQVNQLFYTITGYRQDELVNLEPIELIHPEDREATRENVVKMLKGLSSVPYEYRTITRGGETKWIMETVTSIQYKGKRAALGYFIDITQRKQLENQLLQAQKMEAVGRLAGGVAHDFNNLLMAITGYGELMRAKVLKGDPLYEHLENMLKASERAAGLTRQLLTFSRQQIAHPQVIDLNRVVLDMEQMLRRLIGEDIDLEIAADPGPAAVKADPGHLGQIIMNLVVNARDAMPRGGRLNLKTASVEVKGRRPARFGPMPPGSYVMLMVRDTGEGMDEATQAHIFEPFFTTKEAGKGTGLGLSTVYGIVQQSEGYIDVDSEPGKGSTFTIYLPRLTAIPAPPKTKIPLTARFRGDETILLVEDEDVLRTLLAKFLRLYGYMVLEARHGGEALLLCERHPGTIHLMVTDVVMPQMSGRELAERLAPLRPAMKVVYMSGYTDDSMVHYDMGDLSVPFLQKPFKPIELARKVHAVLHPPGQA